MDAFEYIKVLPLKHIVEEAEKNAIVTALKITKNNRTEAAKKLRISRRVLYYKLAAYGFENINRYPSPKRTRYK